MRSAISDRASMKKRQDRRKYHELAGVAGLEPTTRGFGDRCSTN